MIRAAMVFLATGPAVAEPLRIGGTLDYPPYLWIDEQGDYNGLDADILERICARYDCEIVSITVPELIPSLMSGEIDAVIGGIGNLPSRELLVDFTCPYDPVSSNTGIFVGPPDAPPAREALIGVNEGTVHAITLAEDGFKIRGYPDNLSGVRAVQEGEVDLYFGSSDPIDLAQRQLGTRFTVRETHPLPPLGAAIAVAEGNAELLTSLNAILADMSRSGELEAAQAYWLGNSQADTIALCNTQQLNSKQGDSK